MSTFYFGDGVCNQHTHTHTEALRLAPSMVW
jgi:hypothetical protein